MSWSSLESSKRCPAAMSSTAALMPEWRLGSTSKAFRYLGAGQRGLQGWTAAHSPSPQPTAHLLAPLTSDRPVLCAQHPGSRS